MAVFDQAYKPYEGPLTPEWSRFLIIPRHAFRDVFRSKIFTGCFVLAFVYPLVCAILIYLHNNASALAIMRLNVRELLPIDGSFFETYTIVQGVIAFFLCLLAGPQQVSRDLTNNALPLYLCRPFSRAEYVVGKMSIVIILCSAITWAPGLLLFLFQSVQEGWGWFSGNIWIASSIFLASLVWILVLALVSQTISAWVKWSVVARATLIGVFFIPSAFGGIIDQVFQTRWGELISLRALMANVWAGLFGSYVAQSRQFQLPRNGGLREVIISEPPLWVSWMVLFLVCALCLWLLSRRVKAYEVVK